MSYYIHSLLGRLRLKTLVIRGNQNRAEKVQILLKTFYGIFSVTANTLTGSLLVLYDPKVINEKQIMAVLRENDYFHETKIVTKDHYITIDSYKSLPCSY